MRLLARANDHEPHVGDSVVTLRLEPRADDRLDDRVYAMSAAFTRAMRGNRLRRVLEFEPKNAVVRFVTVGRYKPRAPEVMTMTVEQINDEKEVAQ